MQSSLENYFANEGRLHAAGGRIGTMNRRVVVSTTAEAERSAGLARPDVFLFPMWLWNLMVFDLLDFMLSNLRLDLIAGDLILKMGLYGTGTRVG